MLEQLGKVITPIIHHNGDTRETLLTGLKEAYRAVRSAQNALRDCAPNARNYYPEPGRFEQAMEQHRGRVSALQTVIESLYDEARLIQNNL